MYLTRYFIKVIPSDDMNSPISIARNRSVDFVIIGFVIFLLVKGINKIRNSGKKKDEAPVEEAPATKKCPFCTSEISIEATRCPHCTSQLSE